MNDIITGERSTCVHCRERIGAVIDPYSGSVDWGTLTGNGYGMGDRPEDFGCDGLPETSQEGCGEHNPGDDHTPCGFIVLIDSATYWEKQEVKLT